MILRGVRFKNVMNASGARGFYSEGYWHHRYLKPFGLDFRGSTFIAKTTTLHPRAGNISYDTKTLRPIDRVPSCVVTKLVKGVVLNAVGLSGPGAQRLIPYWEAWKKREPMFVSFMSVAPTAEERLLEARGFVSLLIQNYHLLPKEMGIQVNFSCPNVDLELSSMTDEMGDVLDEFQILGLPLVAKVNALFPIEAAMKLQEHPALDALSVANTIPWGKRPDRIDWKGLFGTETSPLAHLGGGGLSGKPLLPLVEEWVRSARWAGFRKHLIAGGGVLGCKDAKRLLTVGADGIEIGAVSILRPWRVRGIIRCVTELTRPDLVRCKRGQ